MTEKTKQNHGKKITQQILRGRVSREDWRSSLCRVEEGIEESHLGVLEV